MERDTALKMFRILVVVLTIFCALIVGAAAVKITAEDQARAYNCEDEYPELAEKYEGVVCYTDEGENVPVPSSTEGHHGSGELAGFSGTSGGDDQTWLQDGATRRNDDYLIVYNGTRNGRSAVGCIFNNGVCHILEDKNSRNGAIAYEFPFNGDAHSTNFRSKSTRPHNSR